MFGFIRRFFLKKPYRLLYKRRCPPFTFELREYPPIERSICLGHGTWQTTWYPYTQFLIINPLGIPFFPPKVVYMSQTPRPLTSWNDRVYTPGVGNLYDLGRICTGSPHNTTAMGYDGVVKFFWNGISSPSKDYTTSDDAIQHLLRKEAKGQGKRLKDWVLQVTLIPRFILIGGSFSVPNDYFHWTFGDSQTIIKERKRQKAVELAKQWAENIMAQKRKAARAEARRQAELALEQKPVDEVRVAALEAARRRAIAFCMSSPLYDDPGPGG